MSDCHQAASILKQFSNTALALGLNLLLPIAQTCLIAIGPWAVNFWSC